MEKRIYKYGNWFIVADSQRSIVVYQDKMAKRICRNGIIGRLMFAVFSNARGDSCLDAVLNMGLARPLTFCEYAKIGGCLND